MGTERAVNVDSSCNCDHQDLNRRKDCALEYAFPISGTVIHTHGASSKDRNIDFGRP